MAARQNPNNEIEKIIKKLINDRDARIATVCASHYMFFHVYFSHYIKYETAQFHKEILDITENPRTFLSIIVAFRGSGKSTIVTTSLPLWAILGKQQKRHVLIISQTQDRAQQHLRNIKQELETNDLLKRDLGPFREESGQWGLQALELKRSGARIAINSIEQTMRGARHGERRPDLIVLDDIENSQSVKTKEARDKTWSWFTSEVIPAGDESCNVIAVGNLLHNDSMVRRVQDNINNGHADGLYVEYPIIDSGGDPQWHGKHETLEDIEKERQKVMDEVAWRREYLLEIIPDEEQIIPREWIRYYDEAPSSENYNFSVTSIDPAISKNESANNTAMVSAHVHGRKMEELEIYILPNPTNRQLSFLETCDNAKLLSRTIGKHKNAKLVSEDVAYQRSLIEELKRSGYPIKGVKVNGVDKRARLTNVSHLVESGKVLFPQYGCNDLIEQIVGFGSESNDDLADAFSLLLTYIIDEINRPKARISVGRPDLL